MLHTTPLTLAASAKGYMNRVMVYAHRRRKARYLAPKAAHVRSPLANKKPEEYGNTWDPRSGVEWHNRMRHRGHFKHWPWARWTDDPIRFHQDSVCRRTVSAANAAANEGSPEWNYYAEVGRAYETPSHFPLSYTAPFIYQYTSRCWTRQDLQGYLDRIEQESGLRTIIDAAAKQDVLYSWWQRSAMEAIPLGVLQHLVLVATDIVQQNERKAFRVQQHERGVLRTREMVRYYALPHLHGPAMPVALAQPSGEYPMGKFTHMNGDVKIHPLQRPDGRYKHNMYPA
ncbi:hypothetical protein ABL78_7273 [Leptomonas seymouri]|uniref:Uncharacterized protein n=1 Tax=Leptomonas seymouri TaxID=5684 RepID=A0A0N0P338_LEPSE|nr:hypothetical protein ABL78_7273 [Leptomonas seymouri]|eukprot:KPI83679.1 hypothetical protein ABL78_7273 [Leptomonas seymouri]